MTPADIAALVDQLIPAVQKFRANSTIESAILNPLNWAAQGDQQIGQIASVGLGIRLVTHHHLAITLTNAATTAETVTPSPDFPFNLIANSQIAINGGATVYSASGISGLYVAGRRYRSFFRPTAVGGVGPQMDPAWCLVNVGTHGTITNADTGGVPLQLSGIKSISLAGSSDTIITVDFVTEEWFCLDQESMLGALPLQNNSTYATIQRNLKSAFLTTGSTDTTFPFYNCGADVTVKTVSGTSKSQYFYASVPSDASLYQAIVSNSYQVIEQPGVLGTAAVGGLTYNIPQNMYLVALHRILRNGSGAPVMFNEGVIGSQTAEFSNYTATTSSSNKRVVQYNGGGVIPVIQLPYRLRGDQYREYAHDLGMLAGYLLWDGEATANDVQAATDNMGWIDCYNVASPQSVEDLGASISGTPVATFTREAVVAGSVSVVGG